MALAVEVKNVARGGLTAAINMLAADDGRERELTEMTEVAEGVLETADGHVGDFADGIVDDFVAAGLHFGLIHAEDAAGEVFEKSASRQR